RKQFRLSPASYIADVFGTGGRAEIRNAVDRFIVQPRSCNDETESFTSAQSQRQVEAFVHGSVHCCHEQEIVVFCLGKNEIVRIYSIRHDSLCLMCPGEKARYKYPIRFGSKIRPLHVTSEQRRLAVSGCEPQHTVLRARRTDRRMTDINFGNWSVDQPDARWRRRFGSFLELVENVVPLFDQALRQEIVQMVTRSRGVLPGMQAAPLSTRCRISVRGSQ